MRAPAGIWTINGDFVTLQKSGVARYASEVVTAMDRLVASGDPATEGLELTLAAPRSASDLDLEAIPVRIVPEFDSPRLPQFWVQAQLPRHAPGGLVSLCNLAPAFRTRHIACIHDMHTAIMPESYGRLFRLAHNVILPAVGHHAARITTVSELSRGHIAAHGVAPAEKIVIAHNGSDHALRWNPHRARLELPNRPFVVYLARAQAYKNGELVWRIAPRLEELGLDVLVAGAVDDATLRTFGPDIPRNVRLAGRISDDDLAKALGSAVCLLFPSRIEGFGIPAVEAMALGCPVVASDAPCLPEICGDAALFAGPDDDAAWIAHVQNLAANPSLRDKLANAGRTRASRYTWEQTARVYLSLMREVDREKGLAA